MIALRPSAAANFTASENTIVGNTVLYGATSGKLFAAGQQGSVCAFGIQALLVVGDRVEYV